MEPSPPHIGRFAPSPTGPLHFGSLVAALGSHTAARAAGGRWHLRIDDLDPPRQPADAVDTIRRQLEGFGFEWDGDAVCQSTRDGRYDEALEWLRGMGDLYPCTCSRKEIAARARSGVLGPVYPGSCRNGPPRASRRNAIRLRLPAEPLHVADAIQGSCTARPEHDIGDPILRRRDRKWAYHLATAVDDAELGVTHVVRGADLLPAALIQLALQDRLGYPAVRWSHLPVARAANGGKLSKQTGARAVDPGNPLPPLLAAWRFLGQAEPPEPFATTAQFHDWSRRHWSEARVSVHNAPIWVN